MQRPIKKSLKILCSYFNENNTPYVIVGGVAVLFFGRARMTTDIDIIIDQSRLDKDHFIDYLLDNGFDVMKDDLNAIDEGLHGSIFLKESMFRIDIKGVFNELDTKSIEMAREITFDGIKCKFDDPSNIIVHKLYFGSEQDYEDAIAVFIRNEEDLDLDYMEYKAGELDILDIYLNFMGEVQKRP